MYEASPSYQPPTDPWGRSEDSGARLPPPPPYASSAQHQDAEMMPMMPTGPAPPAQLPHPNQEAPLGQSDTVGGWAPPSYEQATMGSWPAPSAAPTRQESWGGPPQVTVAANFGQVGQAVPMSTIDTHKKTDDQWSKSERCSLFFGWVLTLGLWWMLLVTFPVCSVAGPQLPQPPICTWYWSDNGLGVSVSAGPIVAFVLGYLLYAVLCFSSPVKRYLGHILADQSISQHLAQLESFTPTIRWNIVCSHTVRSGKHSRTVVTHRASYDFPYDAWWDISEPMKNTGGAPATRLRLKKEWRAVDNHTLQVHNTQHADWVRANDRDVNKSVTQELLLPHFNPKIISLRNPHNPPPCFGSWWYFLFSFLTLGVLYQHYFYFRTTASDFRLVKVIKRVPRPGEAGVTATHTAPVVLSNNDIRHIRQGHLMDI